MLAPTARSISFMWAQLPSAAVPPTDALKGRRNARAHCGIQMQVAEAHAVGGVDEPAPLAAAGPSRARVRREEFQRR